MPCTPTTPCDRTEASACKLPQGCITGTIANGIHSRMVVTITHSETVVTVTGSGTEVIVIHSGTDERHPTGKPFFVLFSAGTGRKEDKKDDLSAQKTTKRHDLSMKSQNYLHMSVECRTFASALKVNPIRIERKQIRT